VGFSVSAAGLLEGISTFVIFALGFGVPLVILSVAANGQRKWFLRNLKVRHKLINIASGAILIGIGVYDLVIVSQLLQLSV
jgi:cytochrome c biogenesis protein CcdA